MRRENMKVVKETLSTLEIPRKQQVYEWILEQPDGAVFGEIYNNFIDWSPRMIREYCRELKVAGLLRTETCRCHSATVYYGVCKTCESSSFCKKHHHTTKECLAGCECLD